MMTPEVVAALQRSGVGKDLNTAISMSTNPNRSGKQITIEIERKKYTTDPTSTKFQVQGFQLPRQPSPQYMPFDQKKI